MTTRIQFDARYRADPDPWGTDSRAYERAKAADTLAALPDRHLRRAMEMGCGAGTLTEKLAARCDEVLAADFSAEAVRLTRERTGQLAGVRVQQRDLRTQWPAGEIFDLILCSEVLYYWGPDEVSSWLAQAERSLAADGALVCVHWTGDDPEAPMDGTAVHMLLRAETSLEPVFTERRDGYVIDRFDSA